MSTYSITSNTYQYQTRSCAGFDVDSTPCPSQTPRVSPSAETVPAFQTRSTAAAPLLLFAHAARHAPRAPTNTTSTVAPLLPTALRSCCRTRPVPIKHGVYMTTTVTSAVRLAPLDTTHPGHLVMAVPIRDRRLGEPACWLSFPQGRVSSGH